MCELDYGLRLRLLDRESDDPVFFGPGVAELMEQIDREHQMTRACRNMGLSYSKAWRILRCAEDAWGRPLVEGHCGGEKGGAMVLTDEGRALLSRYRAMEQELDRAAERLFEQYFGEDERDE